MPVNCSARIEANLYPMPRIVDDDSRLAVYPYSTRLQPQKIPSADICDAPLTCLRLNSEWAGHVAGALDILRYADAWQGTDAEIDSAIENVEKIIDMVSACWCTDNQDNLRQYQSDNLILQRLLNAFYDGTLTSIDSNVPDSFDGDSGDGGGDGQYRHDALCYAIGQLIDHFCVQALNQLGEYQSAVNLLGTAVTVFGGQPALGFVVTLLGTWLVSVGKEPFEDTQAHEELQCCLLSELEGVANTAVNLATAFDNCATTLSGENSGIIAEAWGYSTGLSVENWVVFCKLLGEGFRYAQAGILAPCACDEWCFYFSFGDNDGGFDNIDISSYPGTQLVGVYSSGNGWIQSDVQYGSTAVTGCTISLTFPLGHVTRVAINYDCSPTSKVGSTDEWYCERIRLALAGSIKYDTYTPNNAAEAVDKWVYWHDLSIDCNRIDIMPYMHGSGNGGVESRGGTVKLKALIVYGVGANPFGTDNC
jgi:hypothetical protein